MFIVRVVMLREPVLRTPGKVLHERSTFSCRG